jgi:D-serine deaminase-like pyridoxal phosphate-dependent protein
MPLLTRRRLLGTAAVGACAASIAALRPADTGAPLTPYFSGLAHALRLAGLATPTLVLDVARLRRNAARVQAHVAGRLRLRLVNKSLPCLGLLDELATLHGTQRQMVFSLPYLALLSTQRPHSDILLGKPLPVAAAAHYLAHRPDTGFDVARQLQWLVDTPERLQQYRELARAQRQPMRINIEIDVGLHRGGVPDLPTLRTMLRLIADEPLLQWAGFMGYDAHTEKIPDLFGSRERARQHVLDTYQAALGELHASPLAAASGTATFNTGGSPTFRLHDGRGPANEVAVGSAMVKPSDFDTPLLADLEPAVFIATPVLKVGEFAAPYGAEGLGQAVRAWDPNQRTAHFIHGGQWLARPVAPAGLAPSGLMGSSSNQQLLLGSGRQALQADDFVFLRPTQSEAVLQQFGDIAVADNGRIVDQWPVFPAAA